MIKPASIPEKSELLNLSQVASLPEDTWVWIAWSGGNGPFAYQLTFPENGLVYAKDSMGIPLKDDIGFVGKESPYTRIWLCNRDEVAKAEKRQFNPGQEAISQWFGLSHASWLTIPRVMLEAMPDWWKAQLAKLLEKYDETFVSQPDVGTRVQVTDLSGRLIKTPAWLLNYRHPDKAAIENLMLYPNQDAPVDSI